VVTEKPGEMIGRYKLLERIGEGGWGVVYRAEQMEPIHRQVALKVVKLGMDTRQVIARFEAERQALALMDHPNIAKVLDAGATNSGRPYFVMELVDGIKITDFCDKHKLPIRERLDLFMRVCEAIQHAHQKGIIHRDIKPSNILVGSRDGGAVPKVIDFGIAKATQGPLMDRLISTGVRQFIGTPAYTSPEQAKVGGSDVDTRSDIYSLGVLLYELLTGHAPFDLDDLRSAPVDGLFLTIRETDPPRPSARLTALTQQDGSAVAERRQTGLQNLLHLVRGDLDWIVMKALEKDRTRRYETANDFFSDIRRHLNNEPVVACPPTRLYRFQKLVRRNRPIFASSAAVAGAVFFALAVSIWQIIEKNKAYRRAVAAEIQQSRLRGEAQTQAARSKQVAQFLWDMLKGVGPSVAKGRDNKMLTEILDQTAERIGRELKGQPVVEAELRATIGDVYLELGEYGKAEAMHREALKLAGEAYGQEHLEVATALENVAASLYYQGKPAEAEALERKVLGMRTRLLGKDDKEVAKSLISLAAFLQAEGKLAEAETVSRQALAANRKLYGSEHEHVTDALNNLACVLCAEDKLAEAEGIVREVVAAERNLHGYDHPDVATSLNNLAKILADQGKISEAEALYRDVLALRRKLLGNEHPDVAQTLDSLAGTLQDRGSLAEAEAMYREALAMRKKTLGSEHPFVALSLNNLADLLDDEGKVADAEAMQREALAMQRKLLGNEHPDVARSLSNLARLIRSQRKSAEAEPMSREALATRRKFLGNDHPDVADSLAQLAGILRDGGRLDDAETLLRECLSIREKRLPDDWLTFSTRSALGENLLARKKYAEAEPLLLSGYNGLREREAKIPAASKRRLKEATESVIRLYEETARPDKAAEWKQRLGEMAKPKKGAD
jgi:serine/threonine protein kinase/Tfp pilus assembly protein PilF